MSWALARDRRNRGKIPVCSVTEQKPVEHQPRPPSTLGPAYRCPRCSDRDFEFTWHGERECLFCGQPGDLLGGTSP